LLRRFNSGLLLGLSLWTKQFSQRQVVLKSIGCLSRKFYNSGDAIEITASILKKL
jgi:hypothetical protein